ncbi:Rpn family recombination-promoting nuclease/putative transposase [Moorella naiadis]|uniref:Rpn family recombination-promoting nuclease/putative transposase n=1 Tax=Moorella naiadis (nom. illeg.) TaxID=3093670 RepID=UPI003D9C812C
MTGKVEKKKKYERLNPKNDFLFKKLFSSPGNEDLLIDLLNTILKPAAEKRINQVTVLNPIKARDHQKDKEAIMDILARANDGTLMTIEIQVADEHDMQKRAIYYWSVVFASQMLIGMQYSELQKTISINILDYVFLKQTQKYHTVFHLREETEGFQLTDIEEIRFIELPKMLARWKRGQLEEERDPLTKWFLLLEANEDQEITRELEAKAMRDTVLRKAIREWERLSQDPRTRAQYLSRLKGKMDHLSALKTAESRGWAEGERKGRIEGERKGRIEGKIEGELETLRKGIIDILSERFGILKTDLSNKLSAIDDPAVLRALLKKSVTIANLEEFSKIAGKNEP